MIIVHVQFLQRSAWSCCNTLLQQTHFKGCVLTSQKFRPSLHVVSLGLALRRWRAYDLRTLTFHVTWQGSSKVLWFPKSDRCCRRKYVQILCPNIAEGNRYINRKGFYFPTVQVVGGLNRKIYNIVARWPESTHDLRIFSETRLSRNPGDGRFQNLILLVDAGYACRPYLRMPFRRAQSAAV